MTVLQSAVRSTNVEWLHAIWTRRQGLAD